jgi:hypothetical protein
MLCYVVLGLSQDESRTDFETTLDVNIFMRDLSLVQYFQPPYFYHWAIPLNSICLIKGQCQEKYTCNEIRLRVVGTRAVQKHTDRLSRKRYLLTIS